MQEVNLKFAASSNTYRTKEAFKTLRSNIEFCGDDVKVISITSCTPNEGKSSVAMEMAKAFAEAGNETILIDADMRKSVLIGRYKTGGVRKGLVHYLAGQHEFEEVMCETNIPNLYIAFAGPVPPNPSELLGSKRFESLLSELRESFRYVIVDTPPLGSVIDAAIAGKNCDGTVLVVESNAVSYRFVQRVKDQLDKANAKILGVVLNKVDMSGRGYYGHYGRYYGKYYGKYYGRYGEEKSGFIESVAERPEKTRSNGKITTKKTPEQTEYEIQRIMSEIEPEAVPEIAPDMTELSDGLEFIDYGEGNVNN